MKASWQRVRAPKRLASTIAAIFILYEVFTYEIRCSIHETIQHCYVSYQLRYIMEIGILKDWTGTFGQGHFKCSSPSLDFYDKTNIATCYVGNIGEVSISIPL